MLGFNADLAPVADVWSNPDNTVIGDRAYSDDFAQAAELIPEAVRGFHSGGVATTLKHFPGHGDALADSHDGAVYVSKPLEQLRREELLPFRAGIASGSDMVELLSRYYSDVLTIAHDYIITADYKLLPATEAIGEDYESGYIAYPPDVMEKLLALDSY